MVEFPQSAPNLTEAASNLLQLIKSRALVAYPSEELRDAVLATVMVDSPRGVRLSKEKQSAKIDAIAALSFACLAAVANAPYAWTAEMSKVLAATVEMVNQYHRRQGSPTYDSERSPFRGKQPSSTAARSRTASTMPAGPTAAAGWGPGPTWRRESRRGLLGLPRGRVTS